MFAAVQVLGGLVFAFGFRRNGLKPAEPQRDFGIWVRQVDRRSITLEALEPRQDIGHPGTLGLYWSGGYGQVGEVRSVEGARVHRSFKLLEGTSPDPCEASHLSECPPADLESYAFPNDPSDRGLEFGEVHYESPLGPIQAWIVPAGDSRRWAIHVHGWTAEKREAIRLLPPLRSAGVTSLVIDYRNDPGAPMDPSGHYRFGVTEWQDVEAAVEHAIDHGAEDVVLVGYSTGGAHSLSFLENSDLRDKVVGVLLDSPNIVLSEVVRVNTADARLPVVNLKVGQLMREMGLVIADWLWKIDWEKTNYVQRAAEIIDVPTLVFHGTSDQRVPIAISRKLEAVVPEHVHLVETPAAGHVMSWNSDPVRYEDAVKSFLRRI